ncbi:nitronate monooxygenase [Curvibacter sp. RS43]|uniref:NAD(P)H-dependent flavin oxidoreductase n=1 Tax=Curvibacter microcysteis TaxID=3026419 RepID=UPI002361A361|nr:nitronate monooxygenase [Curvibacter sp. RS43]MDD0811221.1 nitronate monooxygenase [Curvibacter sp. RS43]
MNQPTRPALPAASTSLWPDSRFSQRYGLSLPVALAPMALASGGALAAACADAGALGLVGGGYGDLAWTQREYTLALQAKSTRRIGCGFITWKLDEDASALDWLLDQAEADLPRALMLSFGDPRPYAARLQARGVDLICQIQRLEQLPLALEAGAQVVVAQGAEAGGHGMNALNGRATFTLVPELADALAAQSPATLLLAAGGIADGRTLAASRVLGADGALVGSRLWASQESLAPAGAKAQAVASTGDGTARSEVFDILRRKNWPAPFDFRALRNPLHQAWESRVEALRQDPAAARADYDAGVAEQDYRRAHATVGEGVGLIHDCPTAAHILQAMDEGARRRLGG